MQPKELKIKDGVKYSKDTTHGQEISEGQRHFGTSEINRGMSKTP